MEVQACDSKKKIFQVFDASKRKRSRKIIEGYEDYSAATDESNSQGAGTRASHGAASATGSLHNMTGAAQGDGPSDHHTLERNGGSSPSLSNSPTVKMHHSPSPRRHRRKERLSLALKAGRVSTPRSLTPQEGDGVDSSPREQDTLLYSYIINAIKKDKKKNRRRHESGETHDNAPERECDHVPEREHARERESKREHRPPSAPHEHRRHHHRRHHPESPTRVKHPKEAASPSAAMQHAMLLETFVKICSQLSQNPDSKQCPQVCQVSRVQSHKSLQCEVVPRPTSCHDLPPARMRSPNRADCLPSSGHLRDPRDCYPPYDNRNPRYPSKLDVVGSRMYANDDKYPDYPIPSRSCLNNHMSRPPDLRPYDELRDPRISYDDDKRKYLEQKTSRSFDVQRQPYHDDERLRRTSRSEMARKRHDDSRDYRNKPFDRSRDRRYDDLREKRYEEFRNKRNEDNRRYDDQARGPRDRHHLPSKDPRSRRNLERCELNSVGSPEEDRDRLSERERDSGLSIADGENSSVSGRSNYLKVVKQEIAEQRESMDKMMKLWKELMRCFKGLSQNGVPGQEKEVKDSAVNVQESAAAQLRLWRECMQRYETVARDVGDTDARLMEEINKQRSEMAEMATMWQECLQRYRDMSNDFNNLKQKLHESPTRMPPPPQLTCAEGEGAVPVPPYRMPPYPPHPGVLDQMVPPMPYPGSPLRGRSSAPPPPWWWSGEQPSHVPPPRRRSSPDSRGSRERRHRRKDHDDSRYKEKSKASGARSEHRHRKK